MKKILLFIIIGIITICFPVKASVNFIPIYNLENDIENNTIKVNIGFKGDEINKVSHTIAYDTKKIRIQEIQVLNGFSIEKSKDVINGRWNTFKVSLDSPIPVNEVYYLSLIINYKDNFKINGVADIKLYDYSASFDNNKYRHDGIILSIHRESEDTSFLSSKNITNKTKYEYFFLDNYILIGILTILVIVFIALIINFNIVKKRKITTQSNDNKELDTSKRKKTFYDNTEYYSENNTVDTNEKSLFSNTGKTENNNVQNNQITKDVDELELPKQKTDTVELPKIANNNTVLNTQQKQQIPNNELINVNKIDFK